MNINAVKSTLVILCSATAIIAVKLFVDYNRRKKRIESNVCEDFGIEGIDIRQAIVEGDYARVDCGIGRCDEDESEKRDDLRQRSILPNQWKRIGKVKELFIYPLESGRGKNLGESLFTEYGIVTSSGEKGRLSLRDRMFMVYKEETGELKSCRNYPTLVLVTLTTAEENHLKLEAVGMPFLKFKPPTPEKEAADLRSIRCTLWWGEKIRCIDCGSDVARWISKFLTGTNSGLRLCCAIGGPEEAEPIDEEPWKKFDDVISSLRDKDSRIDLSSSIAGYLVISESSIDALNQNVNRPRSALQFRPNLVVSGPEPFSEDDWEWIKIGERVAMRNVKPYSRLFSSHKTAILSSRLTADEIFVTLAQKDARRIQIAGEPPTAGIHCGIYKTGRVKIGDDVYVNENCENGSMTRERNDQEASERPESASGSLIREESVHGRNNSLGDGPT